ncbi:hypothetical protein FKW77_000102 [Venturia effusa]|uniref:Uncharacterized protein n=1 Tax=Venturia effusa TaxID=50376 RepID=A0A517LPG8_9PEZI|nr:hypothetical protein FKW77_000102 [Venturia effusa]
MQFKLSLALSALMVLSPAMILEPKGKACAGERALNILPGTDTHQGTAGLGDVRSLEQRPVSNKHKASVSPKSACEKEDESDCTAFCKANDQTSMPGKSQLEEASHLFKAGRSKFFQEDL